MRQRVGHGLGFGDQRPIKCGHSACVLNEEEERNHCWAGSPVRFIVRLATGGPTDIGARAIAPFLGELMKRTALVENKPGATGIIGTDLVPRRAHR